MRSRSEGTPLLSDKSILIVEDNVYHALDLSLAIEESNGRVVGPVGTVAEALALLEKEQIAAAIVDSHLADRDATPVVLALAEKGVPFVIHTETGLPPQIAQLHPDAPHLVSPVHPHIILARLLSEVQRHERRASGR